MLTKVNLYRLLQILFWGSVSPLPIALLHARPQDYYVVAVTSGLLFSAWSVWKQFNWLTSLIGTLVTGVVFFFGLALSILIIGIGDAPPNSVTLVQRLGVLGLATLIAVSFGMISCHLLNKIQRLLSDTD